MTRPPPRPGSPEARRHWIDVDGAGPRFILGVNMETCRRRNGHDLAPNDIGYSYPRGQLSQSYPDAWMDLTGRAAPNRELLRQDLATIAGLGVSAIRVFVSEQMEGIRFDVTTSATAGPPLARETGWLRSPLAEMRARADLGVEEHLLTVRMPPSSGSMPFDVLHVCSRPEYDEIRRRWGGVRIQGVDEVPRDDHPTDVLLRNAAELQAVAGQMGLRVLWVLWLHYGESLDVGWPEVIHFARTRPDRGRGWRVPTIASSNAEWCRHLMREPDEGSERARGPVLGRLPIEAWMYRDVIAERETRRSFLRHFVDPFVRAMEQAEGEPLGYEVMNEPDIVWDDSRHLWTHAIAGGPSEVDGALEVAYHPVFGTTLRWAEGRRRAVVLPETRWRLSSAEIRRFLADSADTVRTSIAAVNPSRLERRLILAGALGSQDPHTTHELSLTRPHRSGEPDLELTASAMTRYAFEREWAPSERPGIDGQGRLEAIQDGRLLQVDRLDAAGARARQQLIHGGRLLLVEAGDNQKYRQPEPTFWCNEHARTIKNVIAAALGGRYAGVFIWHYGDPSRPDATQRDTPYDPRRWAEANAHDANFLTEIPPADHLRDAYLTDRARNDPGGHARHRFRLPTVEGGPYLRPAANEIRLAALRDFRAWLLPPLSASVTSAPSASRPAARR